MSEQEQSLTFNRQLDQLLSGNPAGGDPTLRLAKRLSGLDLSAESAIRESLRQHLEHSLGDVDSRGWLERIGLSLSPVQLISWVKVGLVALAILAQSMMNLRSQPMPTATLEPAPSIPVAITAPDYTETLVSDNPQGRHPLPVPTPGIEAALASSLAGRQPILQLFSAPPTGTGTRALTPKPTPLAPITTLP
jgi:hypothetical protein